MRSVPEKVQPPSDKLDFVSTLQRLADHIPDTVRRSERAISKGQVLVRLITRPSDQTHSQDESDVFLIRRMTEISLDHSMFLTAWRNWKRDLLLCCSDSMTEGVEPTVSEADGVQELIQDEAVSLAHTFDLECSAYEPSPANGRKTVHLFAVAL